VRILVAAPEISPFAKTSEVANVVAALASALARLGHDVRLVMPRYQHLSSSGLHIESITDSLSVPMDGRRDLATIDRTETPTGLPVYLVGSARYLGERMALLHVPDAEPFVFFDRAVLEMLSSGVLEWLPDIIHCHDWQTSLIPNLMRTIYAESDALRPVASVLTVHRLSHQGIFGYRVLEAAGIKEYGFIHYAGMADLDELVDLLGRGIYYSDAVTTVSPTYAQEIQTPTFGEQLDPLLRDRQDLLFGIRNGIDIESYDPSRDSWITTPYDATCLHRRADNKQALQRRMGLAVEPDQPLLAMVSRLADIKGVDLLLEVAPWLVEHLGAQIMVLGTGEQPYHDRLTRLQGRFPRQIAVRFTFDERLQHQVFAGSDMLLKPSRIEPCGLGQMIALRYGSVPVVRAVGGLADTVCDYAPGDPNANGFVFGPADPIALYTAIVRASALYRHRDLWAALQSRGMRQDHSWNRPAQQYEDVMGFAVERHRQQTSL